MIGFGGVGLVARRGAAVDRAEGREDQDVGSLSSKVIKVSRFLSFEGSRQQSYLVRELA